MTTKTEKIAMLIEAAQGSFDAGFLSNAARKRALDCLNSAYSYQRDLAHDAQIDHANSVPELMIYPARNDFFGAYDLPFDLHLIREAHFATFAAWTGAESATLVRDMLALREAIKAAALAPAPIKPELEVKAEAVRASIVDEMKRRHALYLEALDVGRHFGGLPVTVNAHWVHGHKGAIFTRNFFYLRGKLTPLQTILAAADTLKREQEAMA